jgi:protease I
MSRIAILVDRMFEDSEFRVPYDRLRAAGHDVEILGLEVGTKLVGKRGKEHVTIERAVRDVSDRDYDALVIPGGYSPDHLRTDLDAVRFTREMALAHKPVAAVCHAPWMLIEADVTDGRLLTSWRSLRTDLLNAGARWIDREVVVDGNIITSRKPEDLAAFSDAILHQLAEGVPERAEPMLETEAMPEAQPAMH